MSWAYIGLGSNLFDPVRQVNRALRWLDSQSEIHQLRAAPLIITQAHGPVQPDYVNTVAVVQTRVAPLPLLRILQRLERAAGRRRNVRWGPRTLDLDLLMYDDLCLSHPDLELPHPRLHEREFVLAPLMALTRHHPHPLSHPRLDRTVSDLLLAVQRRRRS